MLRSNIVQTVSNSSVVVKYLICLLVISYLIGLVTPIFNFLSLSPSLLLPPHFRIWTLITALPIEATIFNVLIDIPAIVICGLYLEPIWGAMELLRFIAITGIGSAVLASFVSFAAYTITQKYTFWSVQYCGLAGVLGGITVAFKQLLPTQKLDLRFQELDMQQLPFVSILIYASFSFIHVFSYTQAIMVISGVTVGWIYLRFYQPRENGSRGDMNESFTAATLFPLVIRPLVDVISNIVFDVAVKAGICKKPVRTYDVGGSSAIIISLTESDLTDAERRRKKALRELNERLENCPKSIESEDDENCWTIVVDESPDNQAIVRTQLVDKQQSEVSLPTSSTPTDSNPESFRNK